MKKRVLIMSTSAGTGHLRAADALEKAFQNDPRVEEVVHADALKYTNKLFRDFYSKLYLQLVRSAPQVLGWLYKSSDEPWKGDEVRQRFDRLNTQPLVKFIGKFRPDVIVCTHFMPAGIIAHLISKGLLDAHLSIVVTDLDMHAMWLSRIFHRYFLAIDETRAHLEALGLPRERLTVSGIPTDPIFAEPIDRDEVLARYGLRGDLPILLLSAGALGVGPTEAVVGRLLHLRNAAQTIVICGKSETLQNEVRKIVGDRPHFHILGYTDRMHELMKIADLFIGKPGGLTTSEALVCGLPMAIVSPIPGQEERNSDHLLEEGVAVRCNEFTTVPFKIDQLLDDRARLLRMREQALRLGRPDAARVIVETLLEDDLPPLELNEEHQEAISLAAAGEPV